MANLTPPSDVLGYVGLAQRRDLELLEIQGSKRHVSQFGAAGNDYCHLRVGIAKAFYCLDERATPREWHLVESVENYNGAPDLKQGADRVLGDIQAVS